MPAESESAALGVDRRARGITIAGSAVQFLVVAGLVILAIVAQSPPLWALAVQGGFAWAIWLSLWLLFSQRTRAAAEHFETEELRHAEGQAGRQIFEHADETLHLERHRLRWMVRWVLPTFSLLLALAHIGAYIYWHFALAKPISDASWKGDPAPGWAAVVVAIVGCVSFLFSRYASGMARVPAWQSLRAISTYLAGSAVMSLLILLAFGLERLQVTYAVAVCTYVLWIMIVVLGIEFCINFLMEVYRPKAAGDEIRLAYDSRLLALVSEPGGIARSIADAINYQFGFEVSGTWFYQLLQRSMFPLAAFMFVALVALSSVVVVDADQQAVIERFGKPRSGKVLEPGFHLKMPWPVDQAYRVRTGMLRSLVVGTEGDKTSGDEAARKDEHGDLHSQSDDLILWTEKHDFAPHMMVLVSSPQQHLGSGLESGSATGDKSTAGLSLLMCSVAIEYRISDLFDYMYKYENCEDVISSVAHQALTDYAASADIDHIIGPGRAEFEAGLRQEIERRVDRMGLGVELAFVGLQGAHPPAEEQVAAAFQRVVAAERTKETAIERARGEAAMIKTRTAGSVDRADTLDEAIRAVDKLQTTGDADAASRQAAAARVESLLMHGLTGGELAISGQAAADIAEAMAAKTQYISVAESKQRIFDSEMAAFDAAPDVYRMRKYLDMLAQAVRGMRKYILVADPNRTKLIIELDTKESTVMDIFESGN